MISVEEAKGQIIKDFKPVERIQVKLSSALGCTLAQTITSKFDFPTFNNSSVDGFAVNTNDLVSISSTRPCSLPVVGDIPAGQQPTFTLKNGEAARIMTGAEMPTGANAVVMVEDTNADFSLNSTVNPNAVKIFKAVSPGENIRSRGSDITKGQEIFSEGVTLQPQDIGMLAMLGFPSVTVRRKPKIALFSSGDELVPVEEALSSGKIHDSNSYMLTALFEKAGCDVITLGVAHDTRQDVQQILQKAVSHHPDLIVSSAGVSVGAFDYIKNVIEEDGRLNFWKVNMRPGKPLVYGTYKSIPFFGLPGNPVASFVTSIILLLPVINRLKGEKSHSSKIKVITTQDIESDGRESYLRARLSIDEIPSATLTGHQGSGNLFSLVQANGLLIIPAGITFCPKGTELEAMIF